MEAEQPGVSVAAVCHHDASVKVINKRPGATSTPVKLHDLLLPAAGMNAVELGDDRRVFAPKGSDPETVRRHAARLGYDTMMIVPAGVKVHLALG